MIERSRCCRPAPRAWSMRSAAISGTALALRRPTGGAGRRFLPAAAGSPPRARASPCCRSPAARMPFGAEFAHASPAWRDLAPTVCYLSEQHRQSDAPFLDVLAAIRANACIGPHRERLAARLIGRDQLPAACTRLFTHNAAVDDINQQQLAKLGRQGAHLRHDHQGTGAFRATLEARLPLAGKARAQEGRRGDVHQERSSRPLRQRHARGDRRFRCRG